MLRALRQEQSSNANGFFLQAWSGTQGYSSERITRGHIPVENACVSLFGTTQPGAISEFVKHAVVGDREDDGLIQRFGLTAWPDANPEWVNVDRYLNKDACDAAYELFDRLNSLVPAAVGATQDQYDDFPYLRFTPEAYQHFTDWRDTLERRVRGGNLPDALTSHLAKYRGLIPRLALITHLIDEGKGPVGEMSLIKALQWAEYLEPHAARVYSAGVAPARAGAKTLLAKIKAGHLREQSAFTNRDVYRHCWSGLTSAEEAQQAIDILCAHHWLWPNHRTTADGRPMVEYIINPKVKP